jgi:peroxiredoxin
MMSRAEDPWEGIIGEEPRGAASGPPRGRWAGVVAMALAVFGVPVILYTVGGLGGGEAGSRTGLPAEASAPPPALAEVRPGQRAPDFSVRSLGGETFRLSSQRGRVVVIGFLSPGCLDCSLEVSALTRVWEVLGSRGVTVLLVDLSGGPIREAAAYYRSLGGGGFLYAGDRNFRVATRYGVFALGTTVVVDPQGIVRFLDVQATSPDRLLREVRRALR